MAKTAALTPAPSASPWGFWTVLAILLLGAAAVMLYLHGKRPKTPSKARCGPIEPETSYGLSESTHRAPVCRPAYVMYAATMEERSA